MNNWIAHKLKRLEQQLKLYLPQIDITPKRLHQAMYYAVLNGGKRIRPLLVYATGECFDVKIEDLDPAATAIEFIHCYSLVHDDLPAMDNDDLRRGKPTCHKAYDEATAILVGDALQNLAFETLSKNHHSAEMQIQLLQTLIQASSSRGMIGGQMLDMQYVGQTPSFSDIETMHALKTGALIQGAIMLGATLARCNAEQTRILQKFATTIGLAFQIKDDILDAESTTEQLGKTAGLDQRNLKPTVVSTSNIEFAKQRAQDLLFEAQQCLSGLHREAQGLKILADYIINRDH